MADDRLLPRDIDLEDGERHGKFKKLVEDKLSPFHGKTMKDVFMYALGIGFRRGKRLKLRKRVGAIPSSTLSEDDRALLAAIAISEKRDIDVLLGENVKEVAEIAEEYANGGIDLLTSLVFEEHPGDIDKRMEQMLLDIVNERQETKK